MLVFELVQNNFLNISFVHFFEKEKFRNERAFFVITFSTVAKA